MVSMDVNLECLDRLGILKYFPSKPSVISQIGKMLAELCQNDGEAKQLVSAVLDECSEWPGPKALREIHRSAIAARRPQEYQPDGCELCRMTSGWRPVHTLIERTPGGQERKQVFRPDSDPEGFRRRLYAQYAKSPNHSLYEAVAPCSCALGRVRQEQVRKLDEQKGRP